MRKFAFAVAAITALAAVQPAFAAERTFDRDTSGTYPWWNSTAPANPGLNCAQILASPRSHSRSDVAYCRSAERG